MEDLNKELPPRYHCWNEDWSLWLLLLIYDNSNNLPWRHSLENSSTARQCLGNTWKDCKIEWGCARLHDRISCGMPMLSESRHMIVTASVSRIFVPRANLDTAYCNRLHLGLWLIPTVDIPRHAATMVANNMEHQQAPNGFPIFSEFLIPPNRSKQSSKSASSLCATLLRLAQDSLWRSLLCYPQCRPKTGLTFTEMSADLFCGGCTDHGSHRASIHCEPSPLSQSIIPKSWAKRLISC